MCKKRKEGRWEAEVRETYKEKRGKNGLLAGALPLNQLHPNFEAEFSRTRYTLRVPAHSERSVPTRRRKEWSALDVQSVPPGTMQQRASRRTSSHARDCTESALPPTVVGGQQS